MGIFDSISNMMGKGKDKGPQAVTAADKDVLLEKIRQSELFVNVPAQNLEEMLTRMETVQMRTGDVVIHEGGEGDYYYLLVSGGAKISRRVGSDPNPQVVAEVNGPFGFGEEALISNAKRNATITMTSAGTVMRLSKDAFSDYVKDPMITWLSPKEAQDRIAQGGKWIDSREKTGTKEAHLPGSISVPLSELRDRTAELDKGTFYVCYCENARLSSTAAFLMRSKGFQVGVLRGGLQSLKRAGVT